MQHLSQLKLNGISTHTHYAEIHNLANLTSLTLCNTTIGVSGGPAFAFFPTLHSLSVFDGGIFRKHSSLPHCKNLQSLTLEGATCIGGFGASTWRMWTAKPIKVPAAVSSLTKLTTLQLSLHDAATESACDWIWQLTQLKELFLECPHKMQIGASLTRLSLLTFLDVAGSVSESQGGTGGTWTFSVDWSLMHSLSAILLRECSRSHLLGLVRLQSLESIEFFICKPADASAFSGIAYLIATLTASRQDVSVRVDDDELPDAFEAAQSD